MIGDTILVLSVVAAIMGAIVCAGTPTQAVVDRLPQGLHRVADLMDMCDRHRTEPEEQPMPTINPTDPEFVMRAYAADEITDELIEQLRQRSALASGGPRHTERDVRAMAFAGTDPARRQPRELSKRCLHCGGAFTLNLNKVCDRCQPEPEILS